MAPDYWVPVSGIRRSSVGLVASMIGDGEQEGTGTAEPLDPPNADRRSSDTDESIQLREERLKAGKVTEQAGTVEIGKRVVERTESVEVPMREEHLVIEYTPVNERGDGEAIGDARETIEVPLTRERAVVEKETVVTDEVDVRKEAVERRESVGAQVRSEELVVEEHGDVDVRNSSRADEASRDGTRRAS